MGNCCSRPNAEKETIPPQVIEQLRRAHTPEEIKPNETLKPEVQEIKSFAEIKVEEIVPPIKVPEIDSKTYQSFLLELEALVGLFIKSLSDLASNGEVQRYECLDALGIYFNGLLSYLIKTQEVLSQHPEFTIAEEPLIKFKGLIEKLKEEWKVDDFFFNWENANPIQKQKIIEIDSFFKSIQEQLENINPIANHSLLSEDFQKGFENILAKTINPQKPTPDTVNDVKSG